MALKSYGDWDGVPENFEQAVAATLDNLWNQPEMFVLWSDTTVFPCRT
jgi:hypothetical protein